MLTEFNKTEFDYSYKRRISDLTQEFGSLQREIKALDIPVIIMIEGWEASGKGYIISNLVREVDHNHTVVCEFIEEDHSYRKMPFLWRYWTQTPAKGDIYIYDRSPYYNVMEDYSLSEEKINQYIKHIRTFEDQLADSGVLIFKFFLEISHEHQKENVNRYIDKGKEVLVSQRDLDQIENHGKYRVHFSKILNFPSRISWQIIPAEKRRKAAREILTRLVDQLSQAINDFKYTGQINQSRIPELEDGRKIIEGLDMSKSISKEEYSRRMAKARKELSSLSYEFFLRKGTAVVVFEGVDAAGKGGAIKSLVRELDPRLYRVNPTSAPNQIEKAHHYLWRFWKKLPRRGKMAIFDRSWYGRVLVERLENFADKDEWERSYDEINEFEKVLTDSGILVLKYFINIDKDEQLSRFHARIQVPDKNYKLTSEDWRNRKKWDEYRLAYDDMLTRTSSSYVPWLVVEGNDKGYSRLKIIEDFIEKSKQYLQRRENE